MLTSGLSGGILPPQWAEEVKMSGRKKRYSGKFKFHVVLELLQRKRSPGQIAKDGIHPNTLTNWRRHLEEHGPEVFGSGRQTSEYENRIADLEQLLGKKEVEIALLKNFLGRGN